MSVPDMPIRPRSRPVADAPVAELLGRIEDIVRAWAIALIVEQPLRQLGELQRGDFAREAPGLCDASVRALASEEELTRLSEHPGAAQIGAFTGAADPVALLGVVESLRAVLWETLVGALRDPQARQVAELADRLAAICGCVVIQ